MCSKSLKLFCSSGRAVAGRFQWKKPLPRACLLSRAAATSSKEKSRVIRKDAQSRRADDRCLAPALGASAAISHLCGTYRTRGDGAPGAERGAGNEVGAPGPVRLAFAHRQRRTVLRAQGGVAAHFLEAGAISVDTICYRNFEAVPEKADIADPFREVDLFKIPLELRAGPFNYEGRALLAGTPQIPEKRFHFYPNGKAAVRLGAQDMRPEGVHRFTRPDGTIQEAQASDAFVLHYPCCGFQAFWQKYKTLGVFADAWMGAFDIRQAIGPLHLDARDVVAKNDRETALAFYRQRIALEDKTRAEQLIRHGILTRLPQPRSFLNNLARR